MKATKIDETSPLLPAQPAEDPDTTKPKQITPLPKLQLASEYLIFFLILYLCSKSWTVIGCMRLVEPIAYTQIFPYINEFLNSLHVTDNPKRIGFYSGLVVSPIYIHILIVYLNSG